MLAALAFAAAPALHADSSPCPVGTDRWTEYRLFFGRSQGTSEVVTDEAWREFLAEPSSLARARAAGLGAGNPATSKQYRRVDFIDTTCVACILYNLLT